MEAFVALADPIRARVVELLAGGDLTAGDIAARFPVSRPAVSRHLSVLLKSRLVRVRGEAQRRIYSLDPAGLEDVDRWVETTRRTWNARLDALGRHLDDVAARKPGGQHKEPPDEP
ncbi:MAG TPA: metalloregulator ArsR/SmtB family transcription factor [Caulobacteraceae bacterium]|jgi:DNA-binding transcriptional ArsR family regulator